MLDMLIKKGTLHKHIDGKLGTVGDGPELEGWRSGEGGTRQAAEGKPKERDGDQETEAEDIGWLKYEGKWNAGNCDGKIELEGGN